MKQKAKAKSLSFGRSEGFIIFHNINRPFFDKLSWEGDFPKELERVAAFKSFK